MTAANATATAAATCDYGHDDCHYHDQYEHSCYYSAAVPTVTSSNKGAE